VALVGVAEKGYVSYELVVESEGGHSSMPPRETAISILAAALDRLTRHPLPARADSPAFAMMDAIAPDASFAGRVVLANRWLFRPLVERAMAAKPSSDAMLRTTLAPTILEAGVKDNVLPPRARAVVNLRILPGDTIAGVERELVRRIDDPRVHLERLAETASEPSPASDTDDWAYRVLAQSVREVMPEALVAPGLMIGATDSRHYVQLSREIFRFQPILLAPEDFERFHGRDERIATTNLTLAVRVYCRLLEDAAGAAPSSPDARRIDGAEPQT